MSKALGAEIYTLCAVLPRSALPITSQLRRAALSISANIAEGCGKASRAETIRYFEIASGSAAETEQHLEISRELGLIDDARCVDLLDRVMSIRTMLRSLARRLPQ